MLCILVRFSAVCIVIGNQCCVYPSTIQFCVYRSGNQCCVYGSMIQYCVGARVARVAIPLLILKATASSDFLSKCPQLLTHHARAYYNK